MAQRGRAPGPLNLWSLATEEWLSELTLGTQRYTKPTFCCPVVYREGSSIKVESVGLYLVAWVLLNILSVTWSLAVNQGFL